MYEIEEIEQQICQRKVSDEDLWFVVTTRVAWELHFFGYDLDCEILEEARAHVFLCLPEDINLPQVDRLALLYTHEYIDRYQYDRYASLELDEDIFSTIPFVFREALLQKLSKTEKILFHFHYCDRYPLQVVSKNSSIPLDKLESSRRRIINHTRSILETFVQANQNISTDSLENTYLTYTTESWEIHRVERLISRIANLVSSDYGLEDSDIPSSFKGEISNELRKKMKSCPRSSRIFRLLKKGNLEVSDLSVGSEQRSISDIKQHQEKVQVLLLHPDIQDDVDEFLYYMSKHAIQTTSEAWLVPKEKISIIQEILHVCAEKGLPSRHQIRGVIYTGVGMWGNEILLGPLPLRAIDSVRVRAWGEIEGIETLPAPIPPPSNPILWWGGTISSLLIALSSLLWIFTLQNRMTAYPLDLHFKVSSDQVWARFDVDDLSYISIVTYKKGAFEIVGQNLLTEKGNYATGEGRFLVHEQTENIIVISHNERIDDLQNWIQVVDGDEQQFERLRTLILDTYPQSDIRISPTYTPHITTKIQNMWNDMTQNM